MFLFQYSYVIKEDFRRKYHIFKLPEEEFIKLYINCFELQKTDIMYKNMEELKVKVVEVSQEKEQPQGNDYIRVTVEIDGRKIAVWTTGSNINALRFDIDKKR